jgi:hypothetical protein
MVADLLSIEIPCEAATNLVNKRWHSITRQNEAMTEMGYLVR